MARLIKIGKMYYVLSHKYNTAGNPKKKGEKPYVIASGKDRESLRRRVRRMGYSV